MFVKSRYTGPTAAPMPAINKPGQLLQQSIKKTANASSTTHDRKYNIILYGLQECPKGTNRTEQNTPYKKELEKVIRSIC